MAQTNSPGCLQSVGTVFIPVSDQDRALRFYVDKLGFEKRADAVYGGGIRWIEVAPPGSANAIALVSQQEGIVASDDRTYCAFSTGDIDAVHAAFRERGIDVDPAIGTQGSSRPGLLSIQVTVKNPVPPQFGFRDVDRNRFLVVQTR
jgi:catechol 2,3-dioxygenase-like lactoylglutathione lyase family enzyme